MPARAQSNPPAKGVRYQLGQATEIGFRAKNQDRCGAVETDRGVLLILADGMGGHPKGERAAQLVVDTCSHMFLHLDKRITDPRGTLERMVRASHQAVVAYGQKRRPPIEPRSTAIVALIHNRQLYWAHVGDSRLYLLRGGRLQALTVDHSYVQQLRNQGLVPSGDLHSHPFRNFVTRCIGGTSVPPDPSLGGPLELHRGDLILLCTDGLWSQIEGKHIAALLQGDAPLNDSLTQLVELAVHAGAPISDNVTAIALRWLSADTLQKRPARQDVELSRAIQDIRQALDQFREDNE
jgi:serine/threonine protein phosphatase PrpC